MQRHMLLVILQFLIKSTNGMLSPPRSLCCKSPTIFYAFKKVYTWKIKYDQLEKHKNFLSSVSCMFDHLFFWQSSGHFVRHVACVLKKLCSTELFTHKKFGSEWKKLLCSMLHQVVSCLPNEWTTLAGSKTSKELVYLSMLECGITW